ncbi:MAG: YncE family protein [Lewinella sp.]
MTQKRKHFVGRGAMCLLLAMLPLLGLSAQTADLLVVNKVPNSSGEVGSVTFINYEQGIVLDSLKVDREPHEIALTPDRKYALVANTGGYVTPNNTLSFIDVAERSVVEEVDLGPLFTPHGVVYSTAHDLFYFTVEGSQAIGAFDPEAREVVWLYGTGQAGSHMLLVTEDGRTIVTANRDNGSVSVLKLEGNDPLAATAWTSTIVAVGERPEGLAFGPEEEQVYVGLRSGDGIVVVDLEDQEVADSFSIDGHQAGRLLFSPDGRYLIAADPETGSVLFINPADQTVEKVVPVGSTAASLFVPPGKNRLLVGVTGDNRIAEIDLDTLEVIRTLEGGPDPDAMAWPGEN